MTTTTKPVPLNAKQREYFAELIREEISNRNHKYHSRAKDDLIRQLKLGSTLKAVESKKRQHETLVRDITTKVKSLGYRKNYYGTVRDITDLHDAIEVHAGRLARTDDLAQALHQLMCCKDVETAKQIVDKALKQ